MIFVSEEVEHLAMERPSPPILLERVMYLEQTLFPQLAPHFLLQGQTQFAFL